MGRDTFHQILWETLNHPYSIIPVRSPIPGLWRLLMEVPEPPISTSTPSLSPCRATFPLSVAAGNATAWGLWSILIPMSLSGALQRLSNGSVHPDDEAGRVVELQELLEKQNFEVVQAKERISALAASVAELEEDLGTARKDLIKSEEMSSKYQRDLREVRPCPPALPILGQRPRSCFQWEGVGIPAVCCHRAGCDSPVDSSGPGTEGGHGGEDHHAGEAVPGSPARGHFHPRPQ